MKGNVTQASTSHLKERARVLGSSRDAEESAVSVHSLQMGAEQKQEKENLSTICTRREQSLPEAGPMVRRSVSTKLVLTTTRQFAREQHTASRLTPSGILLRMSDDL
jgi:hypothetical protein